ncbi:hypothetical protein D3C86_1842700 [compost metagenome]
MSSAHKSIITIGMNISTFLYEKLNYWCMPLLSSPSKSELFICVDVGPFPHKEFNNI